MIKLKDILEQALPDVPMSTGFKPTETYHREIPEQFLRFYNNDGGNKKGRFISETVRLCNRSLGFLEILCTMILKKKSGREIHDWTSMF